MFSSARKFVSHHQLAYFPAKFEEFVFNVPSLAIKYAVRNISLRYFSRVFSQLPCMVYKGLFSQG